MFENDVSNLRLKYCFLNISDTTGYDIKKKNMLWGKTKDRQQRF